MEKSARVCGELGREIILAADKEIRFACYSHDPDGLPIARKSKDCSIVCYDLQPGF